MEECPACTERADHVRGTEYHCPVCGYWFSVLEPAREFAKQVDNWLASPSEPTTDQETGT